MRCAGESLALLRSNFGMDATNLAGFYDLPLLDWFRSKLGWTKEVSPRCELRRSLNRHTCWLTTINADGSPHVTWELAPFGLTARSVRNRRLTRKGQRTSLETLAVLSVATHDFDLVVEGTGSKISDPQNRGGHGPLGGCWMACPG